MMHDKYEQDDFIAAWVAGELSENDLSGFNEWLKRNPDKQLYFNDIRSLWNETGSFAKIPEPSVHRMWHRISDSLSQSTHPSNVKKRSGTLRFVWIAAAASFFIIVGLNVWLNRTVEITYSTGIAEHKRITLPDSSQVILNAMSAIRYLSNEWEECRQIWLEGEAYFEVKPRPAPFLVYTDSIRTEVLGTSFNIRSRGEFTDVACLTGRVKVSSDLFPHQPVVLTPGLQTRIEILQTPGAPHPSAGNPAGWRAGHLHFNREPVLSVVRELQWQFGVSVKIKTLKPGITFSGVIPLNNRREAFNLLCLATGWIFEVRPDSTIILK